MKKIHRCCRDLSRKRKRSEKVVIQAHHLSYSPEIKVRIFKGEHWIVSLMNRRKKVSKGFIRALEKWIVDNEAKAVEL